MIVMIEIFNRILARIKNFLEESAYSNHQKHYVLTASMNNADTSTALKSKL